MSIVRSTEIFDLDLLISFMIQNPTVNVNEVTDV